MSSWTHTEREPTCPGGGYMRYVVTVTEPNRTLGEKHAFIHVEEGSTEHDEKDCMLLDLETARWLRARLDEALAEAERAEAAVR